MAGASAGNLRLTHYESADAGVIQQSTILRGASLPEVWLDEDGSPTARWADYPWLVVLNQDCDLLLDRLAVLGEPARADGLPVSTDKILRSIVLCPAFLAEHVLAGTYVDGASRWNSKRKDILLGNRDDRYHVLPEEAPFLDHSLILDFKLIVGARPEFVRAWLVNNPEKVVGRLKTPFRDRLLQRFTNYFGRIAEPGQE